MWLINIYFLFDYFMDVSAGVQTWNSFPSFIFEYSLTDPTTLIFLTVLTMIIMTNTLSG